jgi:hypothetical protein
MTMDKSLRVRKGGTSARGVLSRAERIVKLKECRTGFSLSMHGALSGQVTMTRIRSRR